MVRANAEQESWAAEQDQLRPGEHVLVHGPGLGLGLARALPPGGRLVAGARARSRRRHLTAAGLRSHTAGFDDVRTSLRPRKRNSRAVEPLARRPMLR